MRRNHTIVGLDVGTTKTCAVVVQDYRDAQLHVMGIGTAPSYGLKGGQIVDVVLTVKAIDEAIFRAEKAARTRVRSVIAGIAGGHLQSHSQHADLNIDSQDGLVRDRHVSAAVRSAATLAMPPNREVVSVIPKTFAVDHLSDVVDPRGLTGRRVSVEAHVVTGASNALANLDNCVRRAGVDLYGRVLQPLASAEACLTEEQRREGVVLVDIGGGTTDVAIFVEDACWHIAVIPMGGALVTADIARGLRLPTRVAEALKIEHGSVDPRMAEDESTVEAPSFDHGAPAAVRRRDLTEVVGARMEEVLSLIKDEVARSGYYDILPAGAVLTGGGSRIPGLRSQASNILEMPVTMGHPFALRGLDEDMRLPEFCTGIGLALAGARPRDHDGWLKSGQARASRTVDRVAGWMRSVVTPGES